MAEYKLVIGTKSGKCVQRAVADADAAAFFGKKIGQTIDGSAFGLTGYEFLITGGSDNCGFPMRKDNDGSARKKILAIYGIGIRERAKSKGCRQKKSVAGNTIYEKTAQINLKVLKGNEEALLAPPAEAAEEAKA